MDQDRWRREIDQAFADLHEEIAQYRYSVARRTLLPGRLSWMLEELAAIRWEPSRGDPRHLEQMRHACTLMQATLEGIEQAALATGDDPALSTLHRRWPGRARV